MGAESRAAEHVVARAHNRETRRTVLGPQGQVASSGKVEAIHNEHAVQSKCGNFGASSKPPSGEVGGVREGGLSARAARSRSSSSLSTPRARVKDHGLWSEAPKGPQASRADSARKCRRAPEARRRLTRASNVVRHLIAGALVHPEGRTSREARFFPDERKRQPTVTRVPAQEKRQPFFFLRLSSRRTFDEIRAPG